MRFLCADFSRPNSNDLLNLYKTMQTDADSIVESGRVLVKIMQMNTDKDSGIFYFGPETAKKYYESRGIIGACSIAEFIILTGMAITTNLTDSTKYTWNINRYNEIRSTFFFTILTDEGLWIIAPIRLSTSLEITGEVISELQSQMQYVFEKETGNYKISSSGSDTVLPLALDSTMKTQAMNKAVASTRVIEVLSGTDAKPLDYYNYNGDIFVAVSKRDSGKSEDSYIYTMVKETSGTYTFSSTNAGVGPVRFTAIRNNPLVLTTSDINNNVLMPLDTALLDNYGAFVTVSSSYTVPKSGYYRIVASVAILKPIDTNIGSVGVGIAKNGTPIASRNIPYYSTAAFIGSLPHCCVELTMLNLFLIAGDVITMVYQCNHAYTLITTNYKTALIVEGE